MATPLVAMLNHRSSDLGIPPRVSTSADWYYPTQTPAGEVAAAVHIGGYDRLKDTHDAIHAWAQAHNRAFAGTSWEIYGDWSDDPSKLETTVIYLLR
jgi:hypothetical protein